MNNKGNLVNAYKAFRKDLSEDLDYFKFKNNAIVKTYEDRLVKVQDNDREVLRSHDKNLTILKSFEVILYFQTPDVWTRRSRSLNDKIMKEF